jgi:hypothetical protein
METPHLQRGALNFYPDPAEQSGQVIGVGKEPTVKGRSFKSQRKAAAFVRWHEPDDARVSRPDL